MKGILGAWLLAVNSSQAAAFSEADVFTDVEQFAEVFGEVQIHVNGSPSVYGVLADLTMKFGEVQWLYWPVTPWYWELHQTISEPCWVDFSRMPSLLAERWAASSRECYGVKVVSVILIRDVETHRVSVLVEGLDWPLATIEAMGLPRLRLQMDSDAAVLAFWQQWIKGQDKAVLEELYGEQRPPRLALHLYLGDCRQREEYERNRAKAEADVRRAQEALAAMRAKSGTRTMALMGGSGYAITNELQPFAIYSIQSDSNGGVTIQWESASDHLYEVQAASEMTWSTAWETLGIMVGGEGSSSWTDSDAPLFSHRFYRVRRLTFEGDEDGDGLSNLEEFNLGTDLRNADTDGDSIPDGWEVAHGLDPNNPADAAQNADNDGASNWEEYLAGTDPRNENSIPPDNPVKRALDRFNYAQVNLLRWVSGLAPVEWQFATNNAARIAQLRASVAEIVPQFLRSWYYSWGAWSNAVVKWTLPTVLEAIGNTNGTWSGGAPSTNQVQEIQSVVAQLIQLPAENAAYEGVPKSATDHDFESPFHTWWDVTADYPSRWPTDWTIDTYIHFTTNDIWGCVDSCLTVNGSDRPVFPWGTEEFSVDVTEYWLANQMNLVQGWDCISNNSYYCSPFRIVHVLNVPGVEVKFQVKDGRINEGFDPTGGEPWTSVGVGSTNRIVQLVIGGELSPTNFELVVTEGADKVSIQPTGNLTASNELTIVGTGESADTRIEVRLKTTQTPLATLHVMVLPWVTNSIGIFEIVDPESSETCPVGAPSATNVINELNRIFAQACVCFQLIDLTPTNLSVNYRYDNGGDIGLPAMVGNGRLDRCEKDSNGLNAFLDTLAWGMAHWCIYFFRDSGMHDVAGWTPLEPSEHGWSGVFTHQYGETIALVLWNTAHEIGHCLGLATRNDDGEGHDLGAWPAETGKLMRPYLDKPPPPPEPRWMRHEDWAEANYWAKERAKPR